MQIAPDPADVETKTKRQENSFLFLLYIICISDLGERLPYKNNWSALVPFRS